MDANWHAKDKLPNIIGQANVGGLTCRCPNGFLGLFLNDGTFLFLVLLLDISVQQESLCIKTLAYFWPLLLMRVGSVYSTESGTRSDIEVLFISFQKFLLQCFSCFLCTAAVAQPIGLWNLQENC